MPLFITTCDVISKSLFSITTSSDLIHAGLLETMKQIRPRIHHKLIVQEHDCPGK
jgi:hypothetical protein